MALALASGWWWMLLRGVLAIIIAVISFTLPGITFGAVVLLFGVYALIDGVVSMAGAWHASRKHERWGALVLEGIAGIAAATITVLWPAITALVLVYIVAAWALVTGVLEIAGAIKLRKHIAGEWLLALSGVLSILFGIAVTIVPLAGAFTIAICIGVYEMFFGILMVTLAIRLRSFGKSVSGGSAHSIFQSASEPEGKS
jgi:uncharacterized membrane protein HdeD (DUF308 family)